MHEFFVFFLSGCTTCTFYATITLVGQSVLRSQLLFAFVDKFWIFENFFDMPVGLLCARMVDCLDKQVLMSLMCFIHLSVCVCVCLCV